LTRADFDTYDTAGYRAAVSRATGFAGREHDFFLHAKVEHLINALQRRGLDPAAASLLDAGCGVGLMDRLLLDSFGAVAGCDVSPVAVDEARAANPGAEYAVVRDASLPFDDGAFDVTIASCVLHHVPAEERPAFFGELARVTRRDGLVAVFEHNPLNPLTRLVVSRCPFDDDVVLLRPKEVAALARAAGSSVAELRYLLFFPFDRRPLKALERGVLRRVPLGAQYCVVAQV
jgi:SAM-dependent methyltransferase